MRGSPLNHQTVPSRLPLTEVALCAWVGEAVPGDKLVYHRGFLAIDLGPDSFWGTRSERQKLSRVASRAWILGQDGRVCLVQQRESNGEYIYMAVARRRPSRTDDTPRTTRTKVERRASETHSDRRSS